MLMKPNRFKAFLEQLGIQVFYNHTTVEDHDIVEYPYIVFLDKWDGFYADGITYFETIPYLVILHTLDRDYELERKIKKLFKDNNIAFAVNDIRWDSELLFWQVSFNVELV